MSTEAPPLPERRVSLWKRGLIGLGAFVGITFLAMLLVGARTSYSGRSDLASVLAETDRLDPRWRWDMIEEDRPTIANLGNSVFVSRAVVQARAKAEQNDLQTADGKEILHDVPTNLRLDPEQLAVLRKYVTKERNAIALAVTLKDYPRGRAPINLTPDSISTLLPFAQNARDVVHLLKVECESLLHDGRTEEVPDRVRAMLHAGAGMRDEPFLISQLVRFACRAIAARQVERALSLGQLSDEACQKLAEHLAAEGAENLLLAGVRGERATMHNLFDNLHAGRVELADLYHAIEGTRGQVPEVLVRGGAMLYSPRLYEDHANMLRWSNRACKIAAMPIHEQAAEWGTFEKEFKAFVAESRPTFHNMLTILLMPATAKVAQAARRDQATFRCTCATLAAERFRLANRRWPRTLDELRPTFLKEVPIDPYSGKPLLLATTADGIAIYSVGEDGKDDGGKVLDVRMKPGADFGMRLWNVDRRGMAPPVGPPRE